MNSFLMLKNTIIKVIGLAVLSCYPVAVLAQGFPAPNVNVITAEIKRLAPVAWVSGTVVSPNNSQIAAEVSGRLEKLAELGSRVEKGQVIAQIDDTNLKIQLREELANVENSKSKLGFLESEVKRKQTLTQRNLSAKTDLDETISQRDVASADLAAATARLAKIQQQLKDTQVKAPFTGLISQRLKSQGEFISNGTPIIRLVETENLEASLYAPLAAYQFLKQASHLSIDSALGKESAPIKSIVPVADSRSHLMEVRIDLSQVDWPVGLSVRVAVTSGEAKEVLAVPRDALVLRREGTSVFRIKDDNTAEQVSVVTGMASGELIEIKGDVQAGDKIVIRGAERLRSGQAVQIKSNNDQLISGNKD